MIWTRMCRIPGLEGWCPAAFFKYSSRVSGKTSNASALKDCSLTPVIWALLVGSRTLTGAQRLAHNLCEARHSSSVQGCERGSNGLSALNIIFMRGTSAELLWRPPRVLLVKHMSCAPNIVTAKPTATAWQQQQNLLFWSRFRRKRATCLKQRKEGVVTKSCRRNEEGDTDVCWNQVTSCSLARETLVVGWVKNKVQEVYIWCCKTKSISFLT